MSEGSIERRRFLLGAGTAVAAGLATDMPARVGAQGAPNKDAVSVYRKIGFKVRREFNYFVQELKDIKLRTKSLARHLYIREISLDLKDQMMNMWDFSPAWQNTFQIFFQCSKTFFRADFKYGFNIFSPDNHPVMSF